MSAPDLLDLALDAAGGLDRWQRAARITTRLASGGLAFDTKWKRGALRDVEGVIDRARPRTVYSPYPAAGRRGVFEADRVRIETDSGEVLEERQDPRAAFGGTAGLRRNLWWDHLDLLHFAGYALWNYLSAPFMLTRPGFELSEGAPWEEDGERWRRLDVRFPAEIPTHSPEQSFFYDESGLQRRHDYTALPFGRWARATHYCYEHRELDGLTLPTRRRVHPRLPSGKPLRPITLVWIDIASLSLE
ncbi:MAG: hypothetical protein ABI726_05350 [bacterium]